MYDYFIDLFLLNVEKEESSKLSPLSNIFTTNDYKVKVGLYIVNSVR